MAHTARKQSPKKKKSGGGGLLGALSRIPGDFARGGWKAARGMPTAVRESSKLAIALNKAWMGDFGPIKKEGRRQGGAMLKGAAETARHPLRDPFQSTMLALAFTPAGPAARVGAAGKTMSRTNRAQRKTVREVRRLSRSQIETIASMTQKGRRLSDAQIQQVLKNAKMPVTPEAVKLIKGYVSPALHKRQLRNLNRKDLRQERVWRHRDENVGRSIKEMKKSAPGPLRAAAKRPVITRSYKTIAGDKRTVAASRSLLLNLGRKALLEGPYEISRRRAAAGKRGGGYARKREAREEFQRERRKRQLRREAPEGATGGPLLPGIANLPTQAVRLGLPLRARYFTQNLPQSLGMMIGEYGPRGISRGTKMAREMRKLSPDTPADIRAAMGDPGMASFAIGTEGMPLGNLTHKVMHAASAPEARLREVAFYESAARRGYDTPAKIEKLKRNPDSDDYQMVVQEAEEAMGAYSRLSPREHGLMRSGLPIFYPMWKALTRWGVRYPTQHPVQGGLLANLGAMGAEQQGIDFPGGVPPFLPYLVKAGATKAGQALTSNPQNIYQFAPGADVMQALAAPFMRGGLSPTRGIGQFVAPSIEALFGGFTGRQIQTGWPLKEMGPNEIPALAMAKELIPSIPGYDLAALLSGGRFGRRETKAYGKPTREDLLMMYLLGPAWPRKTSIAELTRQARAERTRRRTGR